MEIEPKHIVGYLPFGLKCLAQGEGKKVFDVQGITDLTDVDLHEIGRTVSEQYDIEDVFPILYPLSSLTKDIEVNGEKFVPIVELLKIKHKLWYNEKKESRYSEIGYEINNNYAKAFFSFMASISIDVWINNLENEEYWIIQKLYEWHFDIHGLIEKGLSISKHDV